jgi:hypothetical protein
MVVVCFCPFSKNCLKKPVWQMHLGLEIILLISNVVMGVLQLRNFALMQGSLE